MGFPSDIYWTLPLYFRAMEINVTILVWRLSSDLVQVWWLKVISPYLSFWHSLQPIVHFSPYVIISCSISQPIHLPSCQVIISPPIFIFLGFLRPALILHLKGCRNWPLEHVSYVLEIIYVPCRGTSSFIFGLMASYCRLDFISFLLDWQPKE